MTNSGKCYMTLIFCLNSSYRNTPPSFHPQNPLPPGKKVKHRYKAVFLKSRELTVGAGWISQWAKSLQDFYLFFIGSMSPYWKLVIEKLVFKANSACLFEVFKFFFFNSTTINWEDRVIQKSWVDPKLGKSLKCHNSRREIEGGEKKSEITG